MNAEFSIKVANYQGSTMLNMCDADLLGRDISDKKHVISISKNYYGDKTVGMAEAKNLLRQYLIINMVGKKTVSAAIELGVGSKQGIKTVDGVPFLIVYKA